MIFYVLSESVAARLREHGFKCRTAQISIRDNTLLSFGLQGKFSKPTNLSADLAEKAMELFQANYSWEKPIRSIGVRGCDLVAADTREQLLLFENEERRAKQEKLEAAVDILRRRFGHLSIQRALFLTDTNLGTINPKDDHIIHPTAFFKEGKLP